MFSFDAHAFGLLIALAMATAAFVISLGAVPVVRAIRVVRVFPKPPTGAGESKAEGKNDKSSQTPAGPSGAVFFAFMTTARQGRQLQLIDLGGSDD